MSSTQSSLRFIRAGYLLAVLLGLAAWARPGMAQAINLTPIGTLGGSTTTPSAINAGGQVAGSSTTTATGPTHAFLYSNGVMTDLGTFGGNTSGASAINSGGQIVGFATTASDVGHAFLYSNGVMTDLQPLMPAGTYSSSAYGINDAGAIVGYYYTTTNTAFGFLYSGGTITTLNLGQFGGFAYGINVNGQIVGTLYATGSFFQEAYVYSNGVPTNIDPLFVSLGTSAAINDSGEVVGYYESSSLAGVGMFLYSAGVTTPLGSLGYTDLFPHAINASGQVVGQASGTASASFNHAFLYSNGILTDLNPLLDNSTNTSIAYGINQFGQIAVSVSVPTAAVAGATIAAAATAAPPPAAFILNLVPPKSLGACGNSGDPCVGEPITIGTGNVYLVEPDYSTAGPNPLSFTRYYNSMGAAPGVSTFATTLGVNWRSTYDRYIRINSSTSVSVERADGKTVSFTRILQPGQAGLTLTAAPDAVAGNNWTPDTDVDMTLTEVGNTWTLTDHNDTVETYVTSSNISGALLTSIQARNGYTQTMHYNSGNQLTSVTDSFSRTLTLTYSGGLLQSVATPDNLTLTYSYTSSGANAGVLDQLSKAAYSTTPQSSRTYHYGNASFLFALTGITDEDGNAYSAWTYDFLGRALTSQHGAGAGLTTIVYNDANGSRTVTNALGEQETYKFALLQGVPKVTEIDRLAVASLPAATRLFTYDANGYLASQTDWDTNLTTYTNDVHGQPITMVEASGTPLARTTTVTYDSTWVHEPKTIATAGLTTGFTYDSSGNPLTRTLTDTTTTTSPYSTGGTARTWTYTWSNFLLASAKGPRTDVAELTTFTYDSSGSLTKITNALNQATQITQHLPGGLPQTAIDPNGVITQYTYDARLRLLSSAVSVGQNPLTTTYAYDPAGNLLSVTQPDGSKLTNTYDAAHRLTTVSDLFNQKTAYTLDALGDTTLTSVLNAASVQTRKHTAVFDALGRVLQDIGGVGQTTVYTYDSNGNTLTINDAQHHLTQQVFDAFNRRIQVTDPALGITSRIYDAHDRPTSITNPNGKITTFVYDGFGDLIQQVSPATGTTVYRYDLAGNQTQTVDGNGTIANSTYDALDRVLTTTYPADAAENVAYTYDESGHGSGIGRLTSVTDAAGSLIRSYDQLGNLFSDVRTTNGTTILNAYTYDPANRIASVQHSSGWIVNYSRDMMGRTTSMTVTTPGAGPTLPAINAITYEPFGPVTGLTFGNGVAETRTFDLDYRLTNVSASGASPIESLSYSYDGVGNVVSLMDGVTPANNQSLNYDSLDRQTNPQGSYGSLTYTYDKVGNRQTETPSAPGLAPLDGMGAITNFSYNQAGRLSATLSGSQTIAGYTYDAFGQRILKTQPSLGTTSFYEFDQGGRLLEEKNNQGNPAAADYIYLDDGRPVATLAPGTESLYFLHDDRLGTPQMATDSGKNIVWSANYQPFGQTTGVQAMIVQDLRLPGQQFEMETGFNHNGFRDYVPNLGRYLESDPSGLSAGINLYVYANNNALRFTDPLGLGLNLAGWPGAWYPRFPVFTPCIGPR